MTEGKLNVVCMNDQVVGDFLISDVTNLTGASVSESVEDMVSKVVVVDSTGQTKGELPNTTDIQKFGLIQAICKADPKQDDASQARAMLKTVAHDMSIRAIGHIQCIAGLSVSVQEEQLKGQFFIKSDSHKIEGNKHLMELHLVFNKLLDEQKQELDSTSYNANQTMCRQRKRNRHLLFLQVALSLAAVWSMRAWPISRVPFLPMAQKAVSTGRPSLRRAIPLL